MMSGPGLQTDAQTTPLTKALQLTHLKQQWMVKAERGQKVKIYMLKYQVTSHQEMY